MALKLLIPHEIAERCYLREALYWVALKRFPFSLMTENGVDEREDPEYIDGLNPRMPFESPVTDDECVKAGLQVNPEYRDSEAGTYHQSPGSVRRLLHLDPLAEDDRLRLEKELEESISFYRQQAAWNTDFSVFLDVHETKLFLALREGRLGALGKRLPRRTFAGSLRHFKSTSWRGWDGSTWEPIPADFWISTKINWSESLAEGRNTAYSLILIESEALLRCFPPPDPEHFGGVVKIGNDLALIADNNATPKAVSMRGRPSFKWDEFHVEVARRLKNGAFPAKQEALIAEMQKWCETKWHQNVGRSTLLQKLKPYYDAFVRRSENSDD